MDKFELLTEEIKKKYTSLAIKSQTGLDLFVEERHLIPNIKYFSDTIINYVNNYIKNNRGIRNSVNYRNEKYISVESYQIVLNENDFDQDKVFFTNFNIILNLSVDHNNGNTLYFEGEYSRVNTVTKIVDINGRKFLSDANINLNIIASMQHINETLSLMVYHEFTHAYEDYKRMLNSKKEDSISNYLLNSGTGYLNAFNDEYKTREGKILSDIIYLIMKMETNAFASEVIKFISNYNNRTPHREFSRSDINKLLPQCHAYRLFMISFTKLEELKGYIGDDYMEKLFVNLANSTFGKDRNGKKRYTSLQQLYNDLYNRLKIGLDKLIGIIDKELNSKVIRENKTIYD